MKQVFLALLAVCAVLSGCSKNEDPTPPPVDPVRDLTLRIAEPETRAVSGSEANKANPVVFSDGELFLYDIAERILDTYTFTSTGRTDLSQKIIAISDVTGGSEVVLSNVPGEITHAAIAGNSSVFGTNFEDTYASGSMASVKSYNVFPKSQYNSTTLNLAGATLFGEGAMQTESDTKKTVSITLRPHAARLEIGGITAVTNENGVSVTQYHVNGIYINNYYPSISLDGGTLGGLVNHGQGGTSIYNEGKTTYTAAMKGVIYDSDKTNFFGNSLDALTKYPTGSNDGSVWTYNLLASNRASTSLAPQIIIQVQEVDADNSVDYSGLKYISVGRLLDGNNTEITHFEAGKVYTISANDFKFTVDGVKDEPNAGEIDLHVKVSQIEWTTVPVRPEIQ